ncbi:MAG TPA: cupredoxin domain-containing protein [Methylomirabilota bacterium]|jgi:plastocyanin
MKRLLTSSVILATALAVLCSVPRGEAQDKTAEVPLTAANQAFQPAEVKVKAGEPFVLVVTNNDPKKSIEVENKDLRIEKVVPAGKTVKIRVRALKPGSYVFVDDFNQSAKFKVVAE